MYYHVNVVSRLIANICKQHVMNSSTLEGANDLKLIYKYAV